MEQVLSLLGLALRAGALAVGEEPVGDAARGKKARLLLLCADAAPSAVRRAETFAGLGNCPLVRLETTKVALGGALGRGEVSMAAVTDIGLAGAVAGKLAAADSGRYGPLAEVLEAKAQRTLRRRRKKIARRGKRQS